MTTDPRVIECAKAINASARSGLSYENMARACILKWLEQGASLEMSLSAEKARTDLIKACNLPSHRALPHDRTYTAMCAQAAKELSE